MPCRQGLGIVTLTVMTDGLPLSSRLMCRRTAMTALPTAPLHIAGRPLKSRAPLYRLNMLTRISEWVNPTLTTWNCAALSPRLTEWWPPEFLKLLALLTTLVLTRCVATPATVVGASLSVPVTRVWESTLPRHRRPMTWEWPDLEISVREAVRVAPAVTGSKLLPLVLS